MLLEFECSNHKSIKERVHFSMLAGSDDTATEFLGKFGKFKILRSAVIYGANGSGKSNFIDAISFTKRMIISSIRNQPGKKVDQVPHKLSNVDVPSEYAMQFVRNGIRYAYGFSIIDNLIGDEYLYYFPKGRQVKIFERTGMNVQPGSKYKKSFDISLTILKDNRLFLSCAANYSNIQEIEDAFRFFAEDIVIYSSKQSDWMEYSINKLENDVLVKKSFLDVLQSLGTGIKDIKVKTEKLRFTDLPQSAGVQESLSGMLLPSGMLMADARLVYENFEINLLDESTGIQRLFQMICPILDILNNGKILICDELEKGLHEAIVYRFVNLFKTYSGSKIAQLIFSTHDTSLLDSDLFRRDQVWFTQLNEERATDLYSLVEIKNVRKMENLAKGYMAGKYGAIPMLNKAFFQKLEEKSLG